MREQLPELKVIRQRMSDVIVETGDGDHHRAFYLLADAIRQLTLHIEAIHLENKKP